MRGRRFGQPVRTIILALVATAIQALPAGAAPTPARHVLGPTAGSRHPVTTRLGGGVTFDAYVSTSVGSWPESVAIGDFTGDGRSDVAMSTSFYFDDRNDYRVFLFVQNLDGTLSTPKKYRTDIAYGGEAGLANR